MEPIIGGRSFQSSAQRKNTKGNLIYRIEKRTCATSRHRSWFYSERLEARTLLSTYSVTNLGTFGATDAYAISNNGQVTGAYGSGNTTQPYVYNYTSGTFTVPSLPAGEAYGWGSGINDSGQVAMFGAEPNPAQLYSGGSWQVLPLQTPEFINDAGLIAGSVYSPAGIAHAILYNSNSGVSTDLLGPDNVSGTTIYTNADARSVNSSGQVCGVAITPSGTEGFIYNAGVVTYLPNVDAYGINDIGAVTGHDYSNGQTYIYQNGVVQDLGASGYAFGINNSDEVVGVSGGAAFVYSNGAIQDLNSLIPSNSGWSLSVARAINNNGQIVGFGTYNGQQAAFLLTPTLAPTSLSAASMTATYGSTATFSATLTSNGLALPDQTVGFSVAGALVGTATTDQSGVATLAYGLGTLGVGNYPVQATFAGDPAHQGSAATSVLTVTDQNLQGMAWVDFNNDGNVDFGETGIGGISVTLANPAGQMIAQTVTDANGLYAFSHVPPGTYTISEGVNSASYVEGKDSPGVITDLNGTVISVGVGNNSVQDVFSSVSIAADQNAINYNFGEQPAPGSSVSKGQAAGIGFWQNKNGQALIQEFSSIGPWLADTLPQTFGGLASTSPQQVATLYQQQFVLKDKLNAQVMATALNVYATNASLGAAAAAGYGFCIGAYGLGDSTWNVGTDGTAFNVANGTTLTVMQILQDWDGQTNQADKTLRQMAIAVFGGINGTGGI